jgi:hypothetical protein
VPSLTRGRVFRLQLLLVLVSAVMHVCEPYGTHDYILLSQIRQFPNLESHVHVLYPPKRVAHLHLQALGFLFIASYYLQGKYSNPPSRGDQQTTQSQNQSYFTTGGLSPLLVYSPGTDHTANISTIIACSFVAGETMCPPSCSLATAVVISPVYTAVTWQWVYMSQYIIVV